MAAAAVSVVVLPGQTVSLATVMVATGEVCTVILTADDVPVHPLELVTVTENAPAVVTVIAGVVAPLLQA